MVILIGTLAVMVAQGDTSKLPPASQRKHVTYAKDIKPIFDRHCVRCHGTDKQKGRLRLDSLESALKGGEDGAAIQAGDSARSTLVLNVAQLGDKEMRMPPPDKGSQLTAEQIGLIRAWIDQGAK
jgi:mono/diheme cytochrome c family protein